MHVPVRELIHACADARNNTYLRKQVICSSRCNYIIRVYIIAAFLGKTGQHQSASETCYRIGQSGRSSKIEGPAFIAW